MTKVYSRALDEELVIDRIVGSMKGPGRGPTLIFFGGIHGNEPAGVFALNEVFQELDKHSVIGNIFGVAGSLSGLAAGGRYHQQDLNRLWTPERMEQLENGGLEENDQDTKEQIELYETVMQIMAENKGPYYFFDLHTTSSQTVPFLVVNDSLLNRRYTRQYPLPIILGIEEYLEGPILSYINELGYVSFGFESGQHDTITAIENHVSFIYLSLVFTDCARVRREVVFSHYQRLGSRSMNLHGAYEIYFRYHIKRDEEFEMVKGFDNFQSIKAGTLLAHSNGKEIIATKNGLIFMPLYNALGEDGFFAIRRIPKFFLRLSAVLRVFRMDALLTLLPGVSWADKSKSTLLVNRLIARFFVKDFFHLLGYRSKQLNGTRYLMKNRERASRKSEYREAPWI